MIKHVAVAMTLAITVAACGGKKDDKGGGGGKTKAYKFTTLGITADLPKDVDTSSESMLTGASIGAMSIEERPKQTLDEAKAGAQDYSPQNVKGEALPDGWVLTFDNKGEMGASFFLQVQRDIGGKTYMCSTTQPNNDRIGAVLSVCKSLRP